MAVMQTPLLLAALALGLAATPHCALMCGRPCAALTQGGKPASLGCHAGRIVGYSAAGAAAASSVAALGLWSDMAPALRPLWTLLHLAFLALGLWWLITARQPAWFGWPGPVPLCRAPCCWRHLATRLLWVPR